MSLENNDKKIENYNRFIQKVLDVYNIFIDFFGEERVDLQNVVSIDNYRENRTYDSTFIIVHFPEVTITNEHNRSVVAKDLWVKVFVNYEGKGGMFSVNRSHYYSSHVAADYMHSHVPGINVSNTSEFLSPCLGSGPIRSTIATLSSGYDENIWALYCRELDVYMRTESLTGVPYRRLENINRKAISNTHTCINMLVSNISNDTVSRDFIEYVLNSGKLKFCFYNGGYSLAMSTTEYYVTISNLFIDWYNKAYNNKTETRSLLQLLDSGYLFKGTIDKGYVCSYAVFGNQNNRNDIVNRRVCHFKGNDIRITVEDDTNFEEENVSLFLNINIANKIIAVLIYILNCNYGRESTTANQTVYYL